MGTCGVPFVFRVPAIEDTEAAGWPASLAGFPLGQWTADARRFYNRGDRNQERVDQMERLGMVWSPADTA
ncbi:helicase associated domain-containing protein [Streptomyces sp. NPDC051704]|uniref:helicase associated domain-containing protein n=1 Tax=Streptomyces sp. NPDC051704 TaxID=3365671 RepID=UPI003796FCB9